jgi:hypothetical protein
MPFGYAAFNALASCQRRDNANRKARPKPRQNRDDCESAGTLVGRHDDGETPVRGRPQFDVPPNIAHQDGGRRSLGKADHRKGPSDEFKVWQGSASYSQCISRCIGAIGRQGSDTLIELLAQMSAAGLMTPSGLSLKP